MLLNCPIVDEKLQLGSACKEGAAGELTDTMGGGGSKTYSSNYLHFTTWLSDQEMPVISAPGVYNLMPLYSDNKVAGADGAKA
ncbi:hypothetical protein EHW64_04510 [Erwinia psidii]|uniref:hypothetical protein n=1 Tax=Erwinia psidii TaxID=69224 RepID=UPI00226B3D77|nr:hypothetical protein [Erwinia psidii]MCX8956734.1 hypothetical protein [Erwinia psidii]MCX8960455.1 hypothetical protein [Erwinia psidii]